MNQMVQLTHQKTGPYVDFINSLYPNGVDTPGSEAHTPPVLAGWSARPEVFETIVKPNCRTCHIWQPAHVDFTKLDKNIGELVRLRLCSGIMPNAMSTMINLWGKSVDPFLGELLLDAYGAGSCPVTTYNDPPSIGITEPANGMVTGYGSLGGIDFVATATDAKDGPNCCQITWRSYPEGKVLGYGKTLNFFGGLGSHTITARATDSGYRTATATVSIELTNEPPKVQFITPALNNQSFYKGIPYLLAGDGSEAHRPNSRGIHGRTSPGRAARIRWSSASTAPTRTAPTQRASMSTSCILFVERPRRQAARRAGFCRGVLPPDVVEPCPHMAPSTPRTI